MLKMRSAPARRIAAKHNIGRAGPGFRGGWQLDRDVYNRARLAPPTRETTMIRTLCAALLLLSGLASAAAAADEPAMPAPAESAPPGGMPAPAESAPPPPPGEAGPVVPAGELTEEAAPRRAPDVSYGVAARGRWVSVPEWFLDVFSDENVPLSSWGTGIEFFRRKGVFDLVLSFSYQNMSPPPGNWLGPGNAANIDTDYVVVNGLALWATDISFIWHSNFTDWFGMHYGGGIGLAYVSGEILRISNGPQCNAMNAGDINQCYPVGVTPNGSDTLPLPANLTTPKTDIPDTQQNPRQFRDSNKPPVLPILNAIIGVNFRLPQVRGWEARIEGGFYNAFFVGGAVGYTF
jgi:hypothetical protein